MTRATPVEAVPAATIMMLRPGADGGIETFMVVRHHQIDFASGALVFPGGKADPADFDARLEERLSGAADEPNMRAIQVASIREVFEECGVLLARPRGSANLVDGERLAGLAPYRQRLNDGELTIARFVEQEDLELACDLLVHFAHWITPDMMPKRFDTHFFLCLAPPDHLAVHDGYESVDSVWIEPKQAVEDGANGKFTIIFPTLRNIKKLSEFATPEAALAESAKRPVVTVQPWMEDREDGKYLCIPVEAGYDISEQRMPDRGD